MPFLISPTLAFHWAACNQIKKSLVYVEKQAGTDLPEGFACSIQKHAFKKTFVFWSSFVKR